MASRMCSADLGMPPSRNRCAAASCSRLRVGWEAFKSSRQKIICRFIRFCARIVGNDRAKCDGVVRYCFQARCFSGNDCFGGDRFRLFWDECCRASPQKRSGTEDNCGNEEPAYVPHFFPTHGISIADRLMVNLLKTRNCVD